MSKESLRGALVSDPEVYYGGRHGPTQPDHEHTCHRARSEILAPAVRELGARALRANSGGSARLRPCLPALPGHCPRLGAAKRAKAADEGPRRTDPGGQIRRPPHHGGAEPAGGEAAV